jgi:trimeric autotransporter adhesin
VSNTVWALSVFGSKLYVGGSSLRSATAPHPPIYIAAWDGSAWSTLPVGSSNGVAGSVWALSVFGSKLYVGGAFTTLGDGTTSAKYIAAWDGSAWSNLTVGTSNGVSNTVWALSVFGSRLYVGGAFTTLGDGITAAYSITAWSSASSSFVDDAFRSPSHPFAGLFASVRSIALFGGKAYAGGTFHSYWRLRHTR